MNRSCPSTTLAPLAHPLLRKSNSIKEEDLLQENHVKVTIESDRRGASTPYGPVASAAPSIPSTSEPSDVGHEAEEKDSSSGDTHANELLLVEAAATPPSSDPLGSLSPFSPGLPEEVEGVYWAGIDMRVVTEASRPFRILQATPDWLAYCGFSSVTVQGKTLGIVLGRRVEALCAHHMQKLSQQLVPGTRGVGLRLLSYTRHRLAFLNHVTISPLIDRHGFLRGFELRTTHADSSVKTGNSGLDSFAARGVGTFDEVEEQAVAAAPQRRRAFCGVSPVPPRAQLGQASCKRPDTSGSNAHAAAARGEGLGEEVWVWNQEGSAETSQSHDLNSPTSPQERVTPDTTSRARRMSEGVGEPTVLERNAKAAQLARMQLERAGTKRARVPNSIADGAEDVAEALLTPAETVRRHHEYTVLAVTAANPSHRSHVLPNPARLTAQGALGFRRSKQLSNTKELLDGLREPTGTVRSMSSASNARRSFETLPNPMDSRRAARATGRGAS